MSKGIFIYASNEGVHAWASYGRTVKKIKSIALAGQGL